MAMDRQYSHIATIAHLILGATSVSIQPTGNGSDFI